MAPAAATTTPAKKLVISAFYHCGNRNHADSRNRCGTGPADCGKKHARGDTDKRDSAGQTSDEIISQIKQTLGKPSCPHKDTGGDKKRNCHNRQGIDRRERDLGDIINRQRIRTDDSRESRKPQANGNGNPQNKQRNEIAEQ